MGYRLTKHLGVNERKRRILFPQMATGAFIAGPTTTKTVIGDKTRGTLSSAGSDIRLYEAISGFVIGAQYQIKAVGAQDSGIARTTYLAATTVSDFSSADIGYDTVTAAVFNLAFAFVAPATTLYVGVLVSTSNVSDYFEIENASWSVRRVV